MIDRSMIFDFVVDLIVRTALVFALFLLFTGHNAPGGGFVAGLVAGTALVLRYIARGKDVDHRREAITLVAAHLAKAPQRQ